ncbi:MAG: DUF4040 domain-containing protein [Caldilineaceae bacterium]|nr:DUF4040 domain-containing protein [Caldilineaceae bacterium]
MVTQMGAISQGAVIDEQILWVPQLGLNLALRLDGLALFFGLIVVGIGAAVALYTAYYLENEPRQGYFYSLLFLFMTCMLGLVWSNNLLSLFVFWEGTSITSYLLIAFKHESAEARAGGRRALLVTGLGGLAMLAGLVLLGQTAGTFTISEILVQPNLTSTSIYPAALILILLGAFTKSAQFPFHFWLPGAMSAPTPASAYLHSATMVKAGIYLLARLHPALSDSDLWFWLLLVFGGITFLLGAVSALRFYDMKGLLAYATVSQLGALVMLLAFRTDEAYLAVVIGILAHALYKGPLFLVAGVVDHAMGSRDIRRFGNLWRTLPWTATAALLAGVSMAGIPPTFGFVAKEALLGTFYYFGKYESTAIGWAALLVGAIGGAFFVAYSFTLLWEGFFRPTAESDDPAHLHHAPHFAFVLAPLTLALLGTIAPFVLVPLDKFLLGPAAASIAGSEIEVHAALWHGFNTVFVISLIAIAVGLAIFAARRQFRRILNRTPSWLDGAALFNKSIYAAYDLAGWSTRRVQGGTLGGQVSVILMAAVVMVVYGLLRGGLAFRWGIDWADTPQFHGLVIAVVAVLASIVVVRVQTRLNAIIGIGVVGIMVTLFFVYFSAPDLALTQLLIDVLTVVLLVLVFYRIPPQMLPPLKTSVRVRNMIVAASVGLLGFILVLLASGAPFAESISDYFLLNSIAGGHGANVVNVILVDFRGFDTMGEITVLAIAAVGGYAILRSSRLLARPGTGRNAPSDPKSEDG